VQCAFRAKPILGGRSAWAASVNPELIGKKRRLPLLVMIFHKFLSSQSKTTGDPDRSISAWLDPGAQVETRRSAESSLRSVPILSVTDCRLLTGLGAMRGPFANH
jgi:hypothetical protein